jgi:hypothetical protein
MVQKNEMSARALAMEELENVNGGYFMNVGGNAEFRGAKSEFGVRV